MAHKGGGVDQVNEILFRLSAYKTIKHSLFLFLFFLLKFWIKDGEIFFSLFLFSLNSRYRRYKHISLITFYYFFTFRFL